MEEEREKYLVAYKAGRMILSDKTIEPDDRKGLLYLRRSPVDDQVHIHWMDRKSGAVELDILAAPLGHLEFQRVEACITGRVYVLRFCHSTQRHYFWMQEPDMKRDAEFCRRINELLKDKDPQQDGTSADDGDLDTESGCTTRDLQWPRRPGGNENLAILEEVRQIFAKALAETELSSCRQTVQSRVHLPNLRGGEREEIEAGILTGVPISGVTQTPTTTTMTTTTRMMTTTTTTTPTMLGMRMRMRMPPLVDFSEGLRSYGNEALENLLISPIRRQGLMARMPPRDPDDDDDDEETTESGLIREYLRSPQFHRALSQFSYALSSGTLRLILGPFLIGQDNIEEALEAAQVGDIEGFLRALHRNERD
ncbi:hypothetical protein KR054_009970 [Drosophila jambulina]|nr:hypothetical protein KR054_009970 [Drosophila jambulina]